jgi:hypothetical protein
LNDTPPRRYGPHVEGAGAHHIPAPGPAGSPYVYGYVFVVLGLLVAPETWGTIVLPLLARLYIRKADLQSTNPKHRPALCTKLELAVELLERRSPSRQTFHFFRDAVFGPPAGRNKCHGLAPSGLGRPA